MHYPSCRQEITFAELQKDGLVVNLTTKVASFDVFQQVHLPEFLVHFLRAHPPFSR